MRNVIAILIASFMLTGCFETFNRTNLIMPEPPAILMKAPEPLKTIIPEPPK
jgi:hypothetical protein